MTFVHDIASLTRAGHPASLGSGRRGSPRPQRASASDPRGGIDRQHGDRLRCPAAWMLDRRGDRENLLATWDRSGRISFARKPEASP
jgi:hypothetical protein